MLATALILFLVISIIGAPIFLSLGVAAAVCNLGFLHLPGSFNPQSYFASIDNWILLAVPFFLLSGNIMGNCGPARSLFDLCDKFVGHLRGGLPVAVVLACIFFGAVTGSGVATVVAIGTIAIPEMLKMGYDKKLAFGLIVASGTLGLMIPPSIYMILFASLVQGDVIEYFTAGYLPGILTSGVLVLIAIARSKKMDNTVKATGKERWQALKNALPALSMPILIMVSIYSGVFTPTESAALSAVYAAIISKIFFKETYSIEKIKTSAIDAVYTTSMIFVILGAVTAFSVILTYAQVPQKIIEFAVEGRAISPIAMLLLISIVYLIFGMFIDAVPILYLTVPIFSPVISSMGINMTHFMIVTIMMMMIAQVTPPFGMALFAISGVFNEKVHDVIIASIPYLLALIISVIILIIFPGITTFLPNLLLK